MKRGFKKKTLHQGERISFDLPEYLANSTYKGDMIWSCSSCGCIYTAHSYLESVYIYTPQARVDVPFLLIRAFQILQIKDVKKAHTLRVTI